MKSNEGITIRINKKDHKYLEKLRNRMKVTGMDVVIEKIVDSIKYYGWEKEIK